MGIISGRVFAGKQAGPVGLEPAPGAGSVRFVLRAERIVQVRLLSCDHQRYEHGEYYRQHDDRPRGVDQRGDAEIDVWHHRTLFHFHRPHFRGQQQQRIARAHLAQVDAKLAQLAALHAELDRVIGECNSVVPVADCRILAALSGDGTA